MKITDEAIFERVATVDEIKSALQNASREEDIHKFLSENRGLVADTIGYSVRKHLGLVLSKFPLGSNFVTDFIAFFWDSNVFRVNLIELEPINDPVVTKVGIPSARLSSAIKQVADWKRWVEHGRGDLVLSLRQTIWEHSPNHLAEFFARHWVFSDTNYEFTIFIGRSSCWDAMATERVNTIRRMYEPSVKVYSYDRFIRYGRDAT